MNDSKKFDFVVYGASGFTGKLVVEYIVSQYGSDENISWALAGRNIEKIQSVKDSKSVAEDVPIIKVDSDDVESVTAMVAQTKCVLTTTGPYQLYGNNIVAACAELGTDYVDLCGEPGWMHEKINQHASKAKESGARIVFSCGFDSIPFDLGVLFVQNKAIETHGKPA